MKKITSLVLSFGLVALLSTGLVGCSNPNTAKKEEKKTTTTGPEGKKVEEKKTESGPEGKKEEKKTTEEKKEK
jgi:hypothetical protein